MKKAVIALACLLAVSPLTNAIWPFGSISLSSRPAFSIISSAMVVCLIGGTYVYRLKLAKTIAPKPFLKFEDAKELSKLLIEAVQGKNDNYKRIEMLINNKYPAQRNILERALTDFGKKIADHDKRIAKIKDPATLKINEIYRPNALKVMLEQILDPLMLQPEPFLKAEDARELNELLADAVEGKKDNYKEIANLIAGRYSDPVQRNILEKALTTFGEELADYDKKLAKIEDQSTREKAKKMRSGDLRVLATSVLDPLTISVKTTKTK